MGADNRRHERFNGTLTVQIVGDGTQRFGTIYEISLGGAFLEVSPLPSVGATVNVVVSCDGERRSLAAEVRYRVNTEYGPRGLEGVGVQWKDLTASDTALIQRLVERAQTGKPLRGGESAE